MLPGCITRAWAATCAVIVVFGAVVSAQAPGPKRVEDEVLAVHRAMTRAGEARDADALFSYMLDTTQGSIVQNGVITPTRQEALDQTRTRLQGLASVTYHWDHEYVSVISPDVAVLTASGTSSVTTTSGSSFTAQLAQTVVFVRRGGQWKALHAHQSSPR
jgi:uncharacterized protein (TIGR02246 family)